MISTDENRVVAAVQEWNQNETYNLYVSDTSGVFYSLALENVVSSIGLEGNVMVDLYEVNQLLCFSGIRCTLKPCNFYSSLVTVRHCAVICSKVNYPETAKLWPVFTYLLL